MTPIFQNPVLFCNSPNMMNFNLNFKGIIITLSDAIIRGRNKFKANYWVASNNEFPMPEINFHLDIINSNQQTKFFLQTLLLIKIFGRKIKTILIKI